MREKTPILHPYFLPITFSQCTNKSAIKENAFLYDTKTQSSQVFSYTLLRIYCAGEQGGDPAAHLPGSLPPRERDPVRPGAPIRQDCRHAPCTQVRVPSWQFICFLHGNMTLSALGLPSGKTAVMHLVPRYRAIMAVHVLPSRERDPVRPGAPIRQDCRHAPRTQVTCRHDRSCNLTARSASLSVILQSHGHGSPFTSILLRRPASLSFFISTAEA
jgi:hypothetical protein